MNITKQQHFITLVQTGIAIRYARSDHDAKPAMYWGIDKMDEAVKRSDLIPEDLSALDAAKQFLEYHFQDFREEGYEKHWWLYCD